MGTRTYVRSGPSVLVGIVLVPTAQTPTPD